MSKRGKESDGREHADRSGGGQEGLLGSDRQECLPWFQKPMVHALILVVLGVLIYSNTLHVPFVFDDSAIVNSSIVKDLANLSLPDEDGLPGLYRNRIVGYLSFALNYKVNGLHVVGYHLVNLLIHLVNSLLVYWLVALTLRTPYASTGWERDTSRIPVAYNWVPLLAALLFVSHPVQTQSVTYIVQRFTSLATSFYLLAVVLFVRARSLESSKKQSYTLYAVSVISAVLAMRTKEIAFTLPVMIVLYEAMFFQGAASKRMLYVLPFWLTLLIIPLTLMELTGVPASFSGMDELTRIAGDESAGRWEYLITEFRVIVTYIRLLFLPVGQNLDYDYPVYRSFFNPSVLASFALLVALFGLGIYLLCRSRRPACTNRFWLRLTALGIFWFLVALSVESSIIPISDVIYEHRLYLPSVGFFMAFVAALVLIKEAVIRRVRTVGPVLALAMIVMVSALAMATCARNRVWRDEITLWEDVVAKSPHKARPHNNVGVLYRNQGRLEDAITAYQAAIRCDPKYAAAYYNLGVAYEKLGRVEEAITAYQAATKLRSRFVQAYYNLGVLYEKQGRLEEAVATHQRAIELRPDFVEACYNIGVLYERQGLLIEAVAAYLQAIKRKPDFAEAHNNLGAAYEKLGRVEDAIAAYRKATGLRPDYAEAYSNLGALYERQGRLGAAIEAYRQAIATNPDLAVVHYNLGVLQEKQDRPEDATAAYLRAIKLRPGFVEAHNNLGMLHAKQGRIAEAIAAFQTVIRLRPDLATAYYNLGVLQARQGRVAEAITAYQAAIRLRPDYVDARDNLDAVIRAMGKK